MPTKPWISLIACLLFITCHASAQWYMGGGLSISNLTSQPPVVTSKPHIGWLYDTGVRIPFGLNSRFAIHPQFQLNGIGYRTSYGGSISSYTFAYLSLPVGLNYQPLARWWLNAGIQWNVPVSYSSKADKGGKTRSLKLDMKNRFSLFAGIDFLALPIFSIGARYEQHLSPLHQATVVNPDGTFQNDPFPIRLHAVHLIAKLNLSKLIHQSEE